MTQLFGYKLTPAQSAEFDPKVGALLSVSLPPDHPIRVFEVRAGTPMCDPDWQATINDFGEHVQWQVARYPGHLIVTEWPQSSQKWLVCSELSLA